MEDHDAQDDEHIEFEGKPRKSRQNLSVKLQTERNLNIIEDRLKPMAWAKIAKKYDLSESQCKRVFREWQQEERPKLEGRDPFDIVWESVERYENWIHQLTDVVANEPGDRIKVAAIGQQATLQGKRDELLQKSGILPQNLGKLRIEHDVRYVAQLVVQILVEDQVPVQTQKRIVEALRGNQAPPMLEAGTPA